MQRGRLQPGRMFLVDTAQGRIVADEEIKAALAAEHPYAEWLAEQQIHFDDLAPRFTLTPQHASVVAHQRLFGYTTEDLKILLAPMAQTGAEPIGSMGTDTPLAVLSERPRLLYDYFQQLFAQVTNPPLDAIREELVTSLAGTIGPERNLLAPEPASCNQIVMPQPGPHQRGAGQAPLHQRGRHPARVADLRHRRPVRRHRRRLAGRTPGGGPRRSVARVSEAIADGAKVIVLSDRHTSPELAPIPALLLVSAVHHHLIEEKTRTRVGLVIETGEAREVHHMALLLGYGAAAINPYLAFDTINDLIADGSRDGVTPRQAVRNYIKACGKGVLKIMSKMGISTVASYTGAQVFEAIGLAPEVVDAYFTGTVSRIGGIGLDEIAPEVLARHARAWPARPTELAHRDLEVGGEYQWRREGEYHLFNPTTVHKLQHSTRTRRYDIFKQYTTAVDDQAGPAGHPAGPVPPPPRRRARAPPVPIDEVESGGRDRQALLHRRHVLRIDLGRGPRDAGHRHEPHRRPLQHRRGRRGRRPFHPRPQRRPAPQRHQAGGVGALRGDQRVPGQRRRPPDQDGPGGQARRGRPAARPQGLPVDRQDPLLHPGRGADLAAAPPRHLLHRGPGPAHLRPEERQRPGPGPRQAGRRGRRRHGRRRRVQGPRRRGADLRPRRRDRRVAAQLAQARRAPRGSSAWPRPSRP